VSLPLQERELLPGIFSSSFWEIDPF